MINTLVAALIFRIYKKASFATGLLLLMCTNQVFAQCDAREFSSFETRVMQAYVAYYGRPADPGGLAFWAGELENSGGSLNAIINDFGNSSEYQQRFGNLSSTELVNNIFQQLFGRDADPAGLDFYVGALDSGARTLEAIAIEVLDGSQNDDITNIDNRITVANHYVTGREKVEITDPSAENLTKLIAGVSADTGSLGGRCAIASQLLGDEDAALVFFTQDISEQIIQSNCITCHVVGGTAGATPLLYSLANAPQHEATNMQVISDYLAVGSNRVELYQSKPLGVAHGGGARLVEGSTDHNNLLNLIELLSN